MTARRAETFRGALDTLRDRIAKGDYPSEMRLAPAQLGEEFGLSATPLREALSYLAGEGLLDDRRGDGFFVPRLAARDIADLYRLHGMHLELTCLNLAQELTARPRAAPGFRNARQALAASERGFAAWVAASGGRLLLRSFARVQGQLARVRRLEPEILPDLASEVASVLEPVAETSIRVARLRHFHERRVDLAPVMAERLEQRAPYAKYRRNII